MPLDHSNVTATVSIRGLALGCYNLGTDNYEVGFIRHPEHKLEITVIKNTPAGKEEIPLPQVLPNHRIWIETVGGITPPRPPFYTQKPPEDPDFDRNASGQDPEDFRWIVDLEKELSGNTEVPLISPGFPVTEAKISNPYLYADKEGFALDSWDRVNLDNPAEVEPFGKLCEVIKGDIRCEEGGEVILRIEGSMETRVRLPHLAGFTHGIEIKNECPRRTLQPGEPGDFAIYYSLVESTGGKRFFFRKQNPDVLTPDSTCNGTNAGVRGSLFPLPAA